MLDEEGTVASDEAERTVEDSDTSTAETETTSVASVETEAETEGESETSAESEPLGDKGETTGDSDTSEGEGKNKAKKKIGKLTRDNYRLSNEVERLKTESVQSVTTSEPVAEPHQEDYENYEDFQKAHIAWTVKSAIHQNEVSRRDESAKRFSERKAQERGADFDERADVFKDTTEDFDNVAKSPEMLRLYSDVPHLVEIIEGNEKGPEIAYYLGNNPDVAVKLARLSPYAAAAEVGKLEVKLSREPKPRAVSQAPTPITSTGGGGQGGESKELWELEGAEFDKARRAQIAKRNQ